MCLQAGEKLVHPGNVHPWTESSTRNSRWLPQLPQWLLLDYTSLAFGDTVSICCYLFFALEASSQGVLHCLGTPASCCRGISLVNFSWMFWVFNLMKFCYHTFIYLSIHPSIYLPIYLSSIYFYPSIHPTNYLIHPSIIYSFILVCYILTKLIHEN